MASFAAESSFHGLSYIFGPNRNIFVRICWSFLFMASTCGLCYYIHGAYVKWLVDPDIIIKYNSRNTSEFPLPAFTICPRLYGRNDLFDGFKFSNGTRDLKYISKSECDVIKSNIHWCSFYTFENIDPKCYKKPENLFEDLSATMPEIEFYFNGINLTKSASRTLTSHGICLTYNMYSKDIFNKDVSDDLGGFINENDPEIEWTADKEFFKENSSFPRRLKEDERSNILIRISLLDLENLCQENENKIMKVFIHPPNQFPTRFTEKLDILYGTLNMYNFDIKSFRASESMRIIHPDIRKCFFEDEGNLKYFKTYSKTHCELECFKNELEVQKYINCSAIDLPRDEKSSKDFCMQENLNQFLNVWLNLRKRCKCYENCNYLQYSLKEVHPGFYFPKRE